MLSTMKPSYYAIIGAIVFAAVLATGFIIGRATVDECPKPSVEAEAAWRTAAEGWRIVVEKGVAERRILEKDIHRFDSLLRLPVKQQAHATYRTIVGLPNDSLADRGLADPVQYTGQ